MGTKESRSLNCDTRDLAFECIWLRIWSDGNEDGWGNLEVRSLYNFTQSSTSKEDRRVSLDINCSS